MLSNFSILVWPFKWDHCVLWWPLLIHKSFKFTERQGTGGEILIKTSLVLQLPQHIRLH